MRCAWRKVRILWDALSAKGWEPSADGVEWPRESDTIPAGMRRLLAAMVLTRGLPDIPYVAYEVSGIPLPPGLSWNRPLRCVEIAVPVFTDGHGAIAWFLAARTESDGNVVIPDGMTATAVVAAERALDVAGTGIVLWRRSPEGLPVDGSSLGLPVALGALQLLGGGTPTQPYLATGALEGHGVGRVGRVAEKAAMAHVAGARVFLCPLDGMEEGLADTLSSGSLQCFPVETLDDARLVLHGDSVDANLWNQLLDLCRRSSPWAVLKHLTTKYQADRDSQDDILRLIALADARGCFHSAPEATEDVLATCSMLEKLRETRRYLLPMFSRKWANERPLDEALFRICGPKGTECNHNGDREGFTFWCDLSERCMTAMTASGWDRADPLFVKHFGRVLIDLQNGYAFQTEDLSHIAAILELPSGFIDDPIPACSLIRATYRLMRPGQKREIAEALGALSQHLAFCGKANAALAFSQLSWELLGSPRRLTDRAWIAWDLGDAAEAEACVEEHGGFVGDNNPFRMHMLARRAAERGIAGPAERLMAERLLGDDRSVESMEHPLQLVLFNLGRALAGEELGRRCLAKSLDVCLSKTGTIRFMALLPAAWLNDAAACAAIQEYLRSTGGETELSHFSALLALESSDVPAYVRGNASVLFPFNYR